MPDVGLPDNAGAAHDFPAAFDGQHVAKVAQRQANEPTVVTHELYDMADRLTDVWQPQVRDAASGADQWPHWHYDYDALGELAKVTDPNGHVTQFASTYDANGRRTAHARTLPAVNGATVTETTTYDAVGRALTVTDFKGQTTLYRYDDSPAAGGRVFAEYRYESTRIVDATTVANPDAASLASTRRYDEKTVYGYDALGRQSSVTEYARNPSTGVVAQTRLTTYAYDAVTGGVALVDSPEGKVHHEDDPATGRMTRTWTGTSPANPSFR